ncbi:MAG: 6-bladed beta-propeller [Acidobacteriota bacterium]|nr:6-bladed beta-propeller [Acidobacteriota bacterium]MDY0232103.1 6-bladed beta-propeller [Candidatus Saccharicenans sp.]
MRYKHKQIKRSWSGHILILKKMLYILLPLCLITVLFIFAISLFNSASPVAAAGQKPQLKMVPELTIGQEDGDENLMFAHIAYIDVDAQGNIHVLDTKNRQLRIFSEEGQFLRSIIISPGQGPQELTQFSGMAVTPSGKVFINGNRKMILYDSEGNYLRTFPVTFHVSCIGSPGTEEIVGIGPNDGKILHIFNEEGEIPASFGEVFDVPKDFEPMKMMPMFGAPLVFSCSKDGRIFVLNPHRYEFLVFKDRQLEATIRGTSEIFQPIIQKGRAFISTAASILPAGEFILVYFSSYQNTSNIADIFYKGKKVGSLELPGQLKAVDYQGKLYLVEEQEYPRIIRCSIAR